MVQNYHLLQRGVLKNYFQESTMKSMLSNLQLITFESSFIVRTFFFIIFGLSISLFSLLNMKVFFISVGVIVLIYLIRAIFLLIIMPSAIMPKLFIAPRGLVTILLFFAIPEKLRIMAFDQGILLYVILISSIAMAFILMFFQKNDNNKQERKDDDIKFEIIKPSTNDGAGVFKDIKTPFKNTGRVSPE